MSLDLNLPAEEKEKLRNAVEQDEEYKSMKEQMRAAVLLCTQELMNNAKTSAFEQFHRELPEVENIDTAVSLVAQWLEDKGLIHTLSVLKDEVDPEILASDSTGKTLEEYVE